MRTHTQLAGGAALLCLTALLGASGCAKPVKGPSSAPKAEQDLFAKVTDHEGKPVSRSALLGHKTVLWFYPKAQTSG